MVIRPLKPNETADSLNQSQLFLQQLPRTSADFLKLIEISALVARRHESDVVYTQDLRCQPAALVARQCARPAYPSVQGSNWTSLSYDRFQYVSFPLRTPSPTSNDEQPIYYQMPTFRGEQNKFDYLIPYLFHA
jgi:hypothetical protein